MLDSVRFPERWIFNCVHCLAVWHEDFEVECNGDGHGHDAVLYYRNGQRCVSPWVDHTCDNCNGNAVKARPAPWPSLAKHATTIPMARSRADMELVFRLRRLHAY